ncbi:FmdB family zinc ribbon protein [Solimonas flava]|uniref:FmdB family zinc ribbon protein n=1 Tax=Solimonas flava TaxID=415849 RepID=UPI000406F359|nr:zinc ribbon domain-containing protein [Solimonas flava]
MPIYDYHCTACGADTEVMHKISDPPATVCPACGKPNLVKQVSAAGFRLSGGGWYETDFKSGSKKNIAGDPGGGSTASAESCAPGGCGQPACAAKSDAAV